MAGALSEALASSTAHGISRAATTRAVPLKLMWTLLFLLFVALFIRSDIQLVKRLMNRKLTKSYRKDEVPFVVPDLYFCPSYPYSGSYPYTLTKVDADLLNSEVRKAVETLKMVCPTASEASQIQNVVQSSLPFHLIIQHLAHRQEQCVMSATFYSNYVGSSVKLEPFHNLESFTCYKPILTDEIKSAWSWSVDSYLEIQLMTDPHFADFNFSGHPIQPIVFGKNGSIPFISWDPVSDGPSLKTSGFTMFVVPPGAYPSTRFEHNFHLAPGNAYWVNLRMEEQTYSEDVRSTHCLDRPPQVGFTNPLTWKPQFFNYSLAACYYGRLNARLTAIFGCQNSLHPLMWRYQSWPRCLNVSEANQTIFQRITRMANGSEWPQAEKESRLACSARPPCTSQYYRASYSFGKWPSLDTSTVHFFAESRDFHESVTPALAKLASFARQLQSSNHSAHLETIFRSYISESMLKVQVSVQSNTASQIVMAWSYSFTDCLADTGGLLGLYIGCSLLTVFELVELLYIVITQARGRILQQREPEFSDGNNKTDRSEAAQGDRSEAA